MKKYLYFLILNVGMSNSFHLDVILCLGPFIDAERDFVGLPYWLLK